MNYKLLFRDHNRNFLVQNFEKNNDNFVYKVITKNNIELGTIETVDDLSKFGCSSFRQTSYYKKFLNIINDEFSKNILLENDFDVDLVKILQKYDSIDDYLRKNPVSKSIADAWPKGLDKSLTKSDILVIHSNIDGAQVLEDLYKGKGFDVITDPVIHQGELWRLIKSHRVVFCLGHGNKYGLRGYNVMPCTRPIFKGKNIIAIWCYADEYFTKADAGQGMFITKNLPSDPKECEKAGCGNISDELMYENIVYWISLVGEKLDDIIAGKVEESVQYIRKKYLEQYGNHPVTIYNAYSTNMLGVDLPLPEYEFKGKPLEEKDFPYPEFNEAEFLKNPKASI